jgi:hypothetical protein
MYESCSKYSVSKDGKDDELGTNIDEETSK